MVTAEVLRPKQTGLEDWRSWRHTISIKYLPIRQALSEVYVQSGFAKREGSDVFSCPLSPAVSLFLDTQVMVRGDGGLVILVRGIDVRSPDSAQTILARECVLVDEEEFFEFEKSDVEGVKSRVNRAIQAQVLPLLECGPQRVRLIDTALLELASRKLPQPKHDRIRRELLGLQ